ncbi:MAG: hypothetical protein HC879_22660 [Leptolyngbyaceae cyanobacterium SL_5_9]|nr:hypothetical protein [Leptolyngbyaceae cyanobacterium SL_5_9]NJO73805.1 hypothetical protein [Leptolyngbyaceae cyanobacterium RM1_406_9]
MDFPLILFFLVLAAVVIVFSFYFEQRRTKQLGAIATELNLEFYENGNGRVMGFVQDFQLFSKGRNRRVKNLMQGQVKDAFVAIFDYRYVTGRGKHSHTYDQTVILLRSKQLQVPKFSLHPENFFHKMGNFLGYHDIDFANYPEFSNRYLLRGENETLIHKAFHSEVIAFYENSRGISTEASDSRLIFYRAMSKVPPEEMHSFLSVGLKVLHLFARS